MTQILILLGVLGSVLGYIWKILTDNKRLREKSATDESTQKVKEWQDKIAAVEGKVSEDERNYEDLKKKFDTNNPPGSN